MLRTTGIGQKTPFGETHLGAHRLMVRGAEVAIEGRVGAVDQELEVAELARTEIDRQPISGMFANLGGTLVIDHEVDQVAIRAG